MEHPVIKRPQPHRGRILAAVLVTALVVGAICFTLGQQIASYRQVIQGDRVVISKEDFQTLQSYQRLTQIHQSILKNYLGDVSDEALLDGAAKGMTAALDDPYAYYYTADEYKKLQEVSSGNYDGVGLLIQQSAEGYATVVQVYEGSPAEQAGMQPGDQILAVDGEPLTLDEPIENISAKVKGPKNTQVAMTLLRGEEQVEVTLERKEITIDYAHFEVLDGGIGYVRITEFYGNAVTEFEKALKQFDKQGVKGFIVDLRDNPGGYLDDAVAIADLLLPEGDIVYTEDKNGNREYEKSDAACTDLPFAVLVNGMSASASEVLAGAIQDYGAAPLIGEKTYGKGIVQNIYPFNDGAALKYTIAKYYSPSGRCIHGTGLEPDIALSLPEELTDGTEDYSRQRDTQLQQAIEVINSGWQKPS
ncbi:MAG: S41 family peptidase [Christensenellales bacterium]|jgi:carboxyl-terminal processing protease